MEIKAILEENHKTAKPGSWLLSENYKSLCDPAFGIHEPRYTLFTFVPNHIQKRKNKQLFDDLKSSAKIDTETYQLLTNIFCSEKNKTFPGVGRIRGSFQDLESATRRAEFLIKEVDPFASILICTVGVPFPLVENGFAEEACYIEEGEVDAVLKDHTNKKKSDRENSIREIKRREKQLLDEATPQFSKSPLDHYIELRVKYAQVQHMLNEMGKKFNEYTAIVQRTIKDIRSVEAASPELKAQYFQAYIDACKEVGAVPPEGFLSLLKTSF